MQGKHRALAFALAAALHLMLLFVLPRSDGASGDERAPVIVSLAEGFPMGSSLASASNAGDAVPEARSSKKPSPPADERSSKPVEAVPEQTRSDPATSPPTLAYPLPSPSEMQPDLTAEPVEPGAAEGLLAQLGARLAAGGSAGSMSAVLGDLSGSGDGCRLGEALQAMLQDDAEVTAALSRIPREARSVANALMLWDGAWVEKRAFDGSDGLLPVRRAILAGVSTAPISCREQVISGPMFLAVNGQPGTTLLALGSGSWRWSDLLRTVPLE